MNEVIFTGTAFSFPLITLATWEVPTGWLQLGLGGASLFILYRVLKPLVNAQTRSMSIQAEASTKQAEAMSKLADANARLDVRFASLQAEISAHVQADVEVQRAIAENLEVLVDRVGRPARRGGRVVEDPPQE